VIVLDTHTFVWWVGSPKKLSRAARQVLDRDQDRRISAITLWEVATLVQLGRLRLDRDVEAWLDQALEESAVSVEPIDVEIAVRSTRIGAAFHGDPADRLIAATAIVLEATLVTADEQLHGCSAVKTVW
jgi:PIN domain nuclease of toxin-antitoxin system